ncbi:MAG: hypothetical protein BWY36_00618 [Candidatus Diapherotrites archaeon ADurb.Bin253]|nr:MAG: hypothetical protein BWY36_00618 [Candidatus Diapherotrites archaeon ADurb.Bin253]
MNFNKFFRDFGIGCLASVIAGIFIYEVSTQKEKAFIIALGLSALYFFVVLFIVWIISLFSNKKN